MAYFKRAIPFIIIALVITVAYMLYSQNKKKVVTIGGVPISSPPISGSGIVPPYFEMEEEKPFSNY